MQLPFTSIFFCNECLHTQQKSVKKQHHLITRSKLLHCKWRHRPIMLYEMDATSQLMQHILIPKLLNRWICQCLPKHHECGSVTATHILELHCMVAGGLGLGKENYLVRLKKTFCFEFKSLRYLCNVSYKHSYVTLCTWCNLAMLVN